jgi:DMSO reductase family type II enzyme heme b subunit
VLGSLVGLFLLLWLVFPYISMVVTGAEVLLPMPSVALTMYLLLGLFAAFLYITSDPGRRREFMAPILSFLEAHGPMARVRLGVFVITPFLLGGLIFTQFTPRAASPTGIRIQHPTMPGRFEGLENPLRHPSDERVKQFIREADLSGASLEEARARLVQRYTKEGIVLYQKNCRPCHGVAGGGDGPMARALPLKPANFRDPGTIATVVESFAFWRVNEGGRGLATVGTPWDSAMPVWKADLKEEEIWKILLAEYKIAAVEPRIPEKITSSRLASLAFAQTKPPAAEETVRAGEKVYQERCFFCHGDKGDGNGPIADYLDPRPRDFTLGVFKLRSTASGALPTDEDLFRTVSMGIPGTAMPSWEPYLSEAERWQVVFYIKAFFPEFPLPELDPYKKVIQVSKKIASSSESIAKGGELYEREKCWECHGREGRGEGKKIHELQDEWGFPIRPFNLTKGWRFKGGADPRDIYMRFTTGLNGTPMPSFIHTLSDEERWHLANYIVSMNQARDTESAGATVLVSRRISEEIPSDPDTPLWKNARSLQIPLLGQIIAKPRWQNPSVDLIELRSVHNEKEVSFLLEWDDPTEDTVRQDIKVAIDPEDTYVRVSDLPRKPETFTDSVALQFPVKIPEGPVKPHFFRGDRRNPVNLLTWMADRQSVEEANGSGPEDPPAPQPQEGQLAKGKGVWKNGRWKVVVVRPLVTEDKRDVQFEKGRLIPMAVNVWDGGNGEHGLIMSLSAWYYVTLETPTPAIAYVLGLFSTAAMGLILVRINRRYGQGNRGGGQDV